MSLISDMPVNKHNNKMLYDLLEIDYSVPIEEIISVENLVKLNIPIPHKLATLHYVIRNVLIKHNVLNEIDSVRLIKFHSSKYYQTLSESEYFTNKIKKIY